MTPKQRNALYYTLGQAAVMESIARENYLDALRLAYKSRGISEKRKRYRGSQAQKAGLVEKLKAGLDNA